MPKVSVNILTRNRQEFLVKALSSVYAQTFKDLQVVVVDDCSSDNTENYLKTLPQGNSIIIRQPTQKGITYNRQIALENSTGQYVAILDDDDEWIDFNKLKKQVEFLDSNPEYVLVGGGMRVEAQGSNQETRLRAEKDSIIRSTMMFRNNFFTSSVMFKKEAAVKAGGFIKDEIDLAEDYDLWLRLGKVGKMHNFQEVFVNYRSPDYNKAKFNQFLKKQIRLISRNKRDYPFYWPAKLILSLRSFLNK